MTAEVTCVMCGVDDDLDAAMEDGWTPYVWLSATERVDASVCPSCTELHVEIVDGDPSLIPGHEGALLRSKGGVA